MAITTTLPEDVQLEITNFRYKEYDTLVLQTVRYYPSCSSTSGVESSTINYAETFLMDISVDSVTLTPNSDVVGASGVDLAVEMSSITVPKEGRILI